ncbi:MAG: NAD(P)H-dependent oxidoreductase [Akkermansiaceae bacterium]|nr:NAD(P)H-dependent oxidoreductase [Akkermansiaceae bacterium]NNM28648.1 NAD(P)H-dependent oxidoreductase [Akkermansiaceae bacterium]
MDLPRILAFAGSARTGSFNRMLIRAAAQAAEAEGAAVTLVEMKDYPMPLYDGDLEEAKGMPEKARAFKELLCGSDGFLIASPEYNSSIPPLLKNAIDWASRSESDDEAPLRAFAGKAAGLMAASPGRLGGLRGLVHLRSILGNIGVTVVPAQVAVGSAGEAFRNDGTLTNEYFAKEIRGIATQLVALARFLHGQGND